MHLEGLMEESTSCKLLTYKENKVVNGFVKNKNGFETPTGLINKLTKIE